MDEKELKNWIVVVDDDALSLTSARTLLAAEDMKISCLPSGKSLLKFMTKHDPDLILLDVMMPELDGFETFAALREQEKELDKPETPIIFLTGDSDHETERTGLKLGAADYIHKPFNKDVLVSRIHNTIHKSKMIVNLKEDATKDQLTGFLNKGQGVARIREALTHNSGTLLMVDLDSFKLVNDLYGHKKGDQILREFSDLARECTREGDILCRMGGDEFLLFCLGMQEEESVSSLSVELNAKLMERSKKVLGPHEIPLGVSLGGVMVPEYGTDYDLLFNLADEAMYQTKQNGKHGYSIYKEEEGHSLEADLHPERELSRIAQIMGERNPGREPLNLGSSGFHTVYQFMKRFNAAFQEKSLLLLFLLTPKKELEDQRKNEANVSFREVLKKSLGSSDVIMQCTSSQFVVLLPRANEAQARLVIDKVTENWEKLPQSLSFDIKTASQPC